MPPPLPDHSLFAPMLAMTFLIFAVLIVTFLLRVYHVQNRTVSFGYFRLMQAAPGIELPAKMQAASRNLSNLFEMPVLFYVACLLHLNLGLSDATNVALAWAFVGSRLVHTTIHMTYNNVNHRLGAYFAGIAVLFLLWVRVAVAY